MAALSATPTDETNHLLRLLVIKAKNSTLTKTSLIPSFTPGRAAIRQNCTFLASLSYSLLAAAGAVLAKQWLQAYGRTERTGPVDQQTLKRIKEFIGAQKWGLRLVIETLATLLLASLVLFFIALFDYLWKIEQTIALIVLSLDGTGALPTYSWSSPQRSS